METTNEFDQEDSTPRVLYDDAGDSGTGGGEGDGGDGGDKTGGDGTGGDGGGGDKTPAAINWRDHVGDDLKTHAALAKIENVEGMARSLVSAQQMLGNRDPNSLMTIPAADDAEGRRAALTKLGLPDDVSGYKLTAIDNGVPFMAPDTQLAKDWIAFSHKEGLLPEHSNAAYGFLADYMTKQHADAVTKNAHDAETAANSLRAEWGPEKFDENVKIADFAVEKLGGDELRQQFNDAGLGTSPVLMKALLRVGTMLAEDSNATGDSPAPHFGSGVTPDEARARGKSLLQDAMNEKNPQKARQINEEAQDWFKRANPGTVAP